MKNTISLRAMLCAEFYKTKRNRGFLLLLLFPLLIIFVADIYIIYHNSEATKSIINPWAFYLARYTLTYIGFFYPILVALFCYSVCEMEYKNNSIKQLFSFPVSKSKIVIAKFIFMIAALMSSLLLTYLFFFLSGYLLSFLAPNYGFEEMNTLIFKQVSKFFFVSGIGLFAVMMFQYFLSLLFKSFMIPIAIGGFGVIFGLIAKIWDYIDYVPHATAINAFLNMMKDPFLLKFWEKASTISIGYIFIFGLLSYFYFIKRLGKNKK